MVDIMRRSTGLVLLAILLAGVAVGCLVYGLMRLEQADMSESFIAAACTIALGVLAGECWTRSEW